MSSVEAGRSLDAMVAERVMGWRLIRVHRADYSGGHWCSEWYAGDVPDLPAGMTYWPGYAPGEYPRPKATDSWSPSTEVSDMWEVVEEMRSERLALSWKRRGFSLLQMDRVEGGMWVCEIDGNQTKLYPNGRVASVKAQTAPLAVCLAALTALGVATPE